MSPGIRKSESIALLGESLGEFYVTPEFEAVPSLAPTFAPEGWIGVWYELYSGPGEDVDYKTHRTSSDVPVSLCLFFYKDAMFGVTLGFGS